MKQAAVLETPTKPSERPAKPRRRKSNAKNSERPALLSELIRSRLDGCSRAQRDVAQYIVDHLEESAFQTAEQLAAQVDTSSSTVVRFSQALGFEGFPELQLAAREEYRALRREAETGSTGPTRFFDVNQTAAEAVLAGDFTNLEETARKFDSDAMEGAIQAIADAEQILVCGTDQMAFFASYMRHMLMMLDHRCELVASPSQESLQRLARIGEQTLVIAFSAGRPHTIVTRAMRLASARGARTIAVTDASLSELAKLSDHHLYFSSTSPSFVRSHVGLLAMVQGLTHGLYSRKEAAGSGRVRAFRGK